MKTKRLRTILVDVIDTKMDKVEAEKRLEEVEKLVATYGGVVVLKTIQKKGLPDYRTYIGKGKVKEIQEMAEENNVDLLIVNNILKPRQVYELSEIFRDQNVKVWDRIDLILKIFGKHAESTEAKLQIALASIRHMGPRIFGMGSELMRQAGAVGLRAGQGESNVELMKRHLRRQELKILDKLKHYDTIHAGHRKRRRRNNLKTMALVGYTNAGKSSLLNSLTKKEVYVADALFATLDTRVGKLFIEGSNGLKDGKYQPGTELLVSDTIGFIQNLPPELIKAFKSTLAETVDADLLLHVIDLSDPDIHYKIKVVEEIIEQLGLNDKPKLYVFDKIDVVKYIESEKKVKIKCLSMMRAGPETARALGWHVEDTNKRGDMRESASTPQELRNQYQEFSPVFVSAHEKMNLDKLIEAVLAKI
ncbi:GTPase HflX [Candidatus Gracilibacteria bacterium]|nr:GTPase HflX [Candidatus Gracilibacteria bacterium]